MANIRRRSKVTFPGWVCYAVVLLISGLKGNNALGGTMKARYFGPSPDPVAGEHWMQTAAREIGRQGQGACLCQGEMPLGMEDGRIPDDSITASSYFQNQLNHGPMRARLNTEGYTAGWVPDSEDINIWIQVGFNASVYITGLITQDRGEDGWGHQRATKYQVAYSSDGQTWDQVTDANGTTVEFPGNVEEGTTVTNRFSTLRARFLRILPGECVDLCSMRFEVLGCYPGK